MSFRSSIELELHHLNWLMQSVDDCTSVCPCIVWLGHVHNHLSVTGT